MLRPTTPCLGKQLQPAFVSEGTFQAVSQNISPHAINYFIIKKKAFYYNIFLSQKPVIIIDVTFSCRKMMAATDFFMLLYCSLTLVEVTFNMRITMLPIANMLPIEKSVKCPVGFL